MGMLYSKKKKKRGTDAALMAVMSRRLGRNNRVCVGVACLLVSLAVLVVNMPDEHASHSSEWQVKNDRAIEYDVGNKVSAHRYLYCRAVDADATHPSLFNVSVVTSPLQRFVIRPGWCDKVAPMPLEKSDDPLMSTCRLFWSRVLDAVLPSERSCGTAQPPTPATFVARFDSYQTWEQSEEILLQGGEDASVLEGKQAYVASRVLLRESGDAHRLSECLMVAMRTRCAVAFSIRLELETEEPVSNVTSTSWWCDVWYPVVNRDMALLAMSVDSAVGLRSNRSMSPFYVFVHRVESRPSVFADHPRIVFVDPTPDVVVLPAVEGSETVIAAEIRMGLGDLRDLRVSSLQWRIGCAADRWHQVVASDWDRTVIVWEQKEVVYHRQSGITLRLDLARIVDDAVLHSIASCAFLQVELRTTLLKYGSLSNVLIRRFAQGAAGLAVSLHAASSSAVSMQLLDDEGVLEVRCTTRPRRTVLPIRKFQSVLSQPMTVVEFRWPAASSFSVRDGHVSYLNVERGEAVFRHVVLSLPSARKHWCLKSPNSSAHGASVTVTVTFPFHALELSNWTASSSLTLSTIHRLICANTSQSPTLSVSSRLQIPATATLVTLVSLCVHDRDMMRMLRHQLENINFFLERSIVVIHISPQWRLTQEDARSFAQWNGTVHPMVLVNDRDRIAASFTLLAAVQLQNVRFVVERYPTLHFDRVLLMASNELFVRHGAGAYMDRFDVSMPSSALPSDSRLPRDVDVDVGLMAFHNYPGAVASHVSLYDPDELVGVPSFSSWHSRRNASDVVNCIGNWIIPDRATQRASPRGSRSFPRSQLFTEGSFFRKDIALELDALLSRIFPKALNDPRACFSSWYAWSEVALYSTLHQLVRCGGDSVALTESKAKRLVRCGSRISTVVWNRPEWYAVPRDIYWAQCSPFRNSPPFALKRFRRDPHDPARRVVAGLIRRGLGDRRGIPDEKCVKASPVWLGV